MQKELIDEVANESGFLPRYLSDSIPQDVDGSGCREFLTRHGYTVLSNNDTGRNGQAITACGVLLSTNGYVRRVTPCPTCKASGKMDNGACLRCFGERALNWISAYQDPHTGGWIRQYRTLDGRWVNVSTYGTREAALQL